MVHTLEVHQYHKLRPVFQTMSHHLILESVMAGLTRAAVYVNDVEQPHAALCCHKYRFYLAGEPDNTTFNSDLKPLFDEHIFPQGAAEGREAFVLHPDSAGWQRTIEAIVEGHESRQSERSYFRLTDFPSATPPPDGIRIQPIDEALLVRTHLNNLDALVEEIQSERDSVADFLSKSFGVCAVAGDDIAGLCTSEFNTGARCEVGIMTMEAYQRQGVATMLGRALAAKAQENGITEIGWHCWTRNTPSVATALKIGFQHVRDYPATIGWYGQKAV